MAVGGRLRQRLTLTVACAAQVMMVLDVLIVSVALPSIRPSSTSRLRVWSGW